MRILHINEEENELELYAAVMRHQGHQVLTTENYESGYLLASEQQPEIIVVRVVTRTNSKAFAFAHRIRQDRMLRRTSLLAFVNPAHGGTYPEQATRAGFHQALVLPFELDELVQQLNLYPFWLQSVSTKLDSGSDETLYESALPKRILYVENDTHQATQYIQSLKDYGFFVKHVRSVKSVITILDEDRFDVVLLDIMMPAGKSFTPSETAGGYKTGLALAREIKRLHPLVPLAALTYSEDLCVKLKY